MKAKRCGNFVVLRCFFWALVFFCPYTASVTANHPSLVFVETNGDDASPNPRDPATPLLTVRKAIEIANPRDTIQIGNGIFIEPALTITMPLSIGGQGPDHTSLMNAGGIEAGSVITIDNPGPDALRVDIVGVSLRGGDSTHGGGLLNNGGDVVLRDVSVTGNRAGEEGGGLWNSDTGTLTLQRTVIEGNTGEPGLTGGGIFNNGGTITIENSTIADNAAGDGGLFPNHKGANGGGIANAAGNVIIENTTLSGNLAGNGFADGPNTGGGGNGGGIWNQGTMSILNSTISGNCAGDAAAPLAAGFIGFGGSGGAIDTTGSTGDVLISFSTIVENKAGLSQGGDGFGGGGHNNDVFDRIFIDNSIVSNNTVGLTGGGPDLAGAIHSNGHNIIRDDGFFMIAGSEDLDGVDPLLGSLADNGGPNLTHAPAANSPAVNAADPLTNPAPLTDQRLAPRGVLRDIGSFERVAAPNSPDSDGDGLSDANESLAGFDTDPNNPDTDGDGMPDGWEVDNSLQPKVKDGDNDKDSDGMTNVDEYRLGTNPCLPDRLDISAILLPEPKLGIANPPGNRSYRLLRLDLLTDDFETASEWKRFDPAMPDPDGDGFVDLEVMPSDFVLWRLEGSPDSPPPP